MNQQHEAIRWLHETKGLRVYEIARRMHLSSERVSATLRRLGFSVKPPQHQVRDIYTPKAMPPTVRRDPCFKCGTRGDLPCKHRRAA